jgi:dephospho-CoA kinase
VKVVGLTGGIGMGKSACATLLSERGIPVIDTDLLARQIVEPGQPALAEIRQIFGPEMIASDGTLRRGELARRVFNDSNARQQLESVLHPRIRSLWQAQIEAYRSQGVSIAVVVIPLLFETTAQHHFDAVICVACSVKTQKERLLARGWSETELQQRISAQLPIEKKMVAADYLIWSEGSLHVHAAQLERILAGLSADSSRQAPQERAGAY